MKNEINVLVSGAGIAGLSVAFWLNRYGFTVTVVERAHYIRPGGQAVDLRGPAIEVAERMGVLDKIRDRSTKLTGMSVVDSAGKEIYRSTERTMTGGRFDSPDVEILRDYLCEVFHEVLGDQVDYLFGDSIASIRQDETGVDVTFANAAARRFDLVIGADGLRSSLRRMVFGPDERFMRFLGFYIGVFSLPNFLGLDHWQVFHQDAAVMAGVLAMKKDGLARSYLIFQTADLLEYDYRDIAAQKRLVADRVARAGWEVPRLLAYMRDATDFYFDSTNQIRMDSWSSGRIVLLGDAAYSISPATGQGTTVAMTAAYVLAGELAAHKQDLLAGIASYEHELRDYITSNQDFALDTASAPQSSFGEPSEVDAITHPDGVPDFGQMVQPLLLKTYV